jgi:hypothetical protein
MTEQFTSALKHRPPEEKDFFRSLPGADARGGDLICVHARGSEVRSTFSSDLRSLSFDAWGKENAAAGRFSRFVAELGDGSKDPPLQRRGARVSHLLSLRLGHAPMIQRYRKWAGPWDGLAILRGSVRN